MDITYDDATKAVIIRIPCGASEMKAAPLSKTGKSKMVASTSGFAQVAGAPTGVKLSLNLICAKE